MLGEEFGQKTDEIVVRALLGDFAEPLEQAA
jgi:hypothetical protein